MKSLNPLLLSLTATRFTHRYKAIRNKGNSQCPTSPGQCEVLKEDSSWSKPMDLKKAPYSAHNVRNRSKLVN
jgi:hypothetical protein